MTAPDDIGSSKRADYDKKAIEEAKKNAEKIHQDFVKKREKNEKTKKALETNRIPSILYGRNTPYNSYLR